MCWKTNLAKRPEAELCARRQTWPKDQRQNYVLEDILGQKTRGSHAFFKNMAVYGTLWLSFVDIALKKQQTQRQFCTVQDERGINRCFLTVGALQR